MADSSSESFFKKHWKGYKEFWCERFSFLNNYSRFINHDNPLSTWSASDVGEFIASDAVQGPWELAYNHNHGGHHAHFLASIVFYQDKIFPSTFWKELFRSAITKLKYSTTYHPQPDSQSEEKFQLQANKHRQDVEYHVGDSVFLKIQPYHLKSLARHPNAKLSSRY